MLKFSSKATVKKAEKPEPGSKETIIVVWKVTEGPGLTEAGSKVSEDTYWNENRAADTVRGTLRRF
jgi:hypothetical protein